MSISQARSLVRPAVTLMLVVALVYGFVVRLVPAETFTTITAGVIAFWFGSRQAGKE